MINIIPQTELVFWYDFVRVFTAIEQTFITGVRDYIHVVDLTSDHVAALVKVEKHKLRYRV